MSTVEIRVRPVVRYVVTSYTDGTSVETIGEYQNQRDAENVADALAVRDGAVFEPVSRKDLSDIPLLLVRIVEQLKSGEMKADFGVLTLRKEYQRRPMVFGFGDMPFDPSHELRLAEAELARIAAKDAKTLLEASA